MDAVRIREIVQREYADIVSSYLERYSLDDWIFPEDHPLHSDRGYYYAPYKRGDGGWDRTPGSNGAHGIARAMEKGWLMAPPDGFGQTVVETLETVTPFDASPEIAPVAEPFELNAFICSNAECIRTFTTQQGATRHFNAAHK